MTRKKKTRSIKRIHNVKTGAVQKLKREAGRDRQTGKRVKNGTKSVFQKFLEENPAAKKELVKDQKIAAHKSAVSGLEKDKKEQIKAAELAEIAARKAKYKEERAKERATDDAEVSDSDLLDKLDQNFLGDIY